MTLVHESMKQLYQLIFSFLILVVIPTKAQSAQSIDSLLTALENANSTTYISILDKLSSVQNHLPTQKAFNLGAKVLATSQSLSFRDAVPHAYRNVAQLHLLNNNFSEALDLSFRALQYSDKYRLQYEMAQTIAFLAQIYTQQGNITLAVEYKLSAGELFRGLQKYAESANLFGQIGQIYFEEDEFEKAILYYEQAIETANLDSASLFNPLMEFHHQAGIVLRKLQDYDQASLHLKKALYFAQKVQNSNQMALITGEIGKIYKEQGNISIAVRYMEMDLTLSLKSKNWNNVAEVLNHIGEIQTNWGNYRLAQQYYDSALAVSEKIKNLAVLSQTYKGLASLQVKRKNYQKAYEFQLKYTHVRDSLLKQKKALKLAKVYASHSLDKKQAEIKRLTENNQAHEETIKKQTIVNTLIIVVLLLVTGLTFVFFRANRQRARDNEILKQRQEEIQMQRDALVEKGQELETAFTLLQKSNKRMTDSINYARHIQTSIFTSISKIQKNLPESFILFQPRDVVSGDFYWSITKGQRTILAAVDCTGHGVPGAFLSVIGNNLLHEIVILRNIMEADKILNELHLGVRTILRQAETENRDGMDVSLCVVHRTTGIFAEPHLEFAGAKNPLVYIQDNELHVVRGDKFPIGGKQLENQRLFTKHIITLDKPTSFYIFSDGFQDQFGGTKGRKFMRKRFYNLLHEIHLLSADVQKKQLENTLLNWMHPEDGTEYRQIDDVLVIGAKV